MKRPSRPTKDVTDAFTSRGKTELYVWLWDNFEQLPAYQKYRISWQKLAAALTDLGIKARDRDKPLTVGIVRKTYERVRLDREQAASAAETAGQTTARPTQTNREQVVTDVQHNRTGGFAHNSTVKVDPDEWGPAKK